MLATGYALAASLSVTVNNLGSGSAAVSAPPGISVTDISWVLSTADYAYVDQMIVVVTTTAANPGGTIYFGIKDNAGNVLYQFSNFLPSGAGTWTYTIDVFGHT